MNRQPLASNPLQGLAPIHAIIVTDCSTSIRGSGILPELLGALNDTVGELRTAGSLVSVVFFNGDIMDRHWRVPAAEIPPFTTDTYPIDKGTRLYDAITCTITQLEEEVVASHGEMNPSGSVVILIFTDGEDSGSRDYRRMDARLAMGKARQRGWRISFMATVAGLADDLGLQKEETRVVKMQAGAIQDTFREVTRSFSQEALSKALQALEQRGQSAGAASPDGSPGAPVVPEPIAAAPAPPVMPTPAAISPTQAGNPPSAPASPSAPAEPASPPNPPQSRPWWRRLLGG